MDSEQRLNEIIKKLELVEILDDIVRGDPDRGTEGLQYVVNEVREDLRQLKHELQKERDERQGKANFLSAIGMKDFVQFLTTFGALAMLVLAIWQSSGS